MQSDAEDHEIWRNNPVSQTVLAEFPRNQGKDYNAEATAEYLIRQFFSSQEDYIAEAHKIGRSIGERELLKKA